MTTFNIHFSFAADEPGSEYITALVLQWKRETASVSGQKQGSKMTLAL